MKPSWLKLSAQQPANKYRNKKHMVNGIEFDSKKEAGIYADLKAQLDRGEIADLELQKRFELIPAQYESDYLRLLSSFPEMWSLTVRTKTRKRGKCVCRGIDYVADFYVKHLDGEEAIIDCKGMKTAVYKLKKKLMRWIHGIEILEV